MPAYRIDHPSFDKPRLVEADNPRRARAHAAKEFDVRRLDARQLFDLVSEGGGGLALVDITTKRKG